MVHLLYTIILYNVSLVSVYISSLIICAGKKHFPATFHD